MWLAEMETVAEMVVTYWDRLYYTWLLEGRTTTGRQC